MDTYVRFIVFNSIFNIGPTNTWNIERSIIKSKKKKTSKLCLICSHLQSYHKLQNITNHQLTAAHAKILGTSVKLNMPKTVLIVVFGIERTKLILEGRRVLPTKTLSYGFTFEYGEIEKALKHLLCY